LTVSAPEFWLYFLGALFIGVTLYMPQGVVGLVRKVWRQRETAQTTSEPVSNAQAKKGGVV
jgi:urea transport system permease protein